MVKIDDSKEKAQLLCNKFVLKEVLPENNTKVERVLGNEFLISIDNNPKIYKKYNHLPVVIINRLLHLNKNYVSTTTVQLF